MPTALARRAGASANRKRYGCTAQESHATRDHRLGLCSLCHVAMCPSVRRRAVFRRRPAFTVVELLVVIGIVAVLLAIALPAVQAARESARRTRCRNNLKQLGMAVQAYHDVCHTLPVSVGPWAQGPRPAPQRNGKGWIVSILPQLEQQALYDQFVPFFDGDFFTGYGLKSVGCRPLLQHQLPVLQCPADASVRGTSPDQFELWGIDAALTSYKGVLGDSRLAGKIGRASCRERV